jgi:starch synthase
MARVLAVASEIFPLVKTGGLGDVAGALPLALAAAGVEVVTMVPGYPAVMAAIGGAAIGGAATGGGEAAYAFADLFGGPATVVRARAAGLELLVLDAPHLFDRPGNPYLAPGGAEWFDNAVRFAGLGAAAAAIGAGVAPGLSFDIVHAHDWQAALAPVYLRFHPGSRPGTVLTVHNLAFQGRYPAAVFPRLGLPEAAFGIDGLEFHGDVSFLKGGLSWADRVTTVSPTYAREITGAVDGMGLDGLLRQRAGALTGILNGIDEDVWDPARDGLIAAAFSRGRLGKRGLNKAGLQQRMGLEADPAALLAGVVSRMTEQKGLDLLVPLIPGLVAGGAQLAVLGSGEPAMERAFAAAASAFPGRVGCVLGYDEPLAHLMQAGCDALLVPSRFEPCGLTQMYALRYGTVPVVARVGGLADTVIDANAAALAAGAATGIQFAPVTLDGLAEALGRLLRLWGDRPAWARVQRNAMAADVSWRKPAAQYAALYDSLLQGRV